MPAPRRRAANTLSFQLEHAIVATFLFGGAYACNEFCKYYKNVENLTYKFIPAVDRTCYDGDVSHVTGIVVISDEEFADDAGEIRRPLASRQLCRRRAVDGSLHRQGQAGSPRARSSATWRSSGYR